MDWNFFIHIFEYEKSYNDIKRPWSGHKDFAYDLIANINPAVVVELGTERGTSLFSFSQAIKDLHLKTKISAVDTWEGDEHAGYYGKEVFESVKNIVNKHYSGQEITLKKKLFDEALSEFEDNSIDILHIDGLHTYKAVKHDYDSWLPKVKRGGIILFHDIAVKRSGFGVYKLWAELIKTNDFIDFEHSNGLGVLFLDKNKYSEIIKNKAVIKGYYERINSANDLKNEINKLCEENKELSSKLKIYESENARNKEQIYQLGLELQSIKDSRTWKLRNLAVRTIKRINEKN